jgi:hypothetical protein
MTLLLGQPPSFVLFLLAPGPHDSFFVTGGKLLLEAVDLRLQLANFFPWGASFVRHYNSGLIGSAGYYGVRSRSGVTYSSS